MAWFHIQLLEAGVFVTLEPAVDPMFRAAMVTVSGRDRDLQFDFDCGLLPLRPRLHLTGKPVVAVASHSHIDHIGGFDEFDDRLGHEVEAAGFAGLPGVETFADEFRTWPNPVSKALVPGWCMSDWVLRPAPLTQAVTEGDRIDLGDRSFIVLHLLGHSVAGIGLLDESDGLFLSTYAKAL